MIRATVLAAFIAAAIPLWSCRPSETHKKPAGIARSESQPQDSVELQANPWELLEVWRAEGHPPKTTPTYDIKIDRPIVVGGIRVDGILVPFATFNGHEWLNHWPTPQYGLDTSQLRSISLSRVPAHWWGGHAPVLQWWVVRRGAISTPVAVTAASFAESLCGVNPALLTDFVSGVPFTRRNGGAAFAGIAASTSSAIMPIDVVDAGSREFVPVYREILALFGKLEPGVWPARTIPQTTNVPRVIGLYASDLPDGSRLFAFRAERRLPFGTTAVVGWIHRDSSSNATVTQVRAFEADPDGKDEAVLHPEAMLQIDGHTFWLGIAYGYESHTYFVLDVGKRQPVRVLEVDAGGC